MNNLSVRQLREKIKSNEYERLPESTKNKLINHDKSNIVDFVKNPIMIKNSSKYDVFSEKVLQKLILEDIENFLDELGTGFTFIKSEYPIKLGEKYNYIDLLDYINYDYMRDIEYLLDVVKLRKKGKKFSFEEHLKALIISLLSNHRWGDNNIRENMETIDKIFHNYDKNYLKVVDPDILITELRKIHCTNPMINYQMKALSKNIMLLETIEKDYGSLDKFVKKETPNDIANMFNFGKYKLIQVGRTFAYDYLKRVGVNTCKKSSQLERLFGSHRLGIVENANATEQQVLNIIKKIAELNKCDEIIVESIIQQFCLLRSANICGEHPNCERCKIRKYCNHNKKCDDICLKI